MPADLTGQNATQRTHSKIHRVGFLRVVTADHLVHTAQSRNFVFGLGKSLFACIFLSEWHSENRLLEISLYMQLLQKCPFLAPVGCLPPLF